MSIFGTVGQFFRSATTDAPYLGDLVEWLGTVQTGALERWLPIALRGMACSDQNAREGFCSRTAVAVCEICRHPVCVQHSFVGRTAEVVCVQCVAGARTGRPRAQDPRETRRVDPKVEYALLLKKHFKILGLKTSSTFEQTKARYKSLALKHHEDRGGDSDRMKTINVAFEWLKKNHFAQ